MDEEFIGLCNEKELIDVNFLLKKMHLPKRFVNILLSKKFYDEKSLQEYIEYLFFLYQSTVLFPGQLIAYYPQIKTLTAKKDIICQLSGTEIKAGSEFCKFYCFVENIITSQCYVGKKVIHVDSFYEGILPKDLHTYEDWYCQLKNSHLKYNINNEIDFYTLSIECSDTCLELKSLGLKKSQKEQKNN